VQLPEIVLLLFLTVLLYWDSLTTSLREICGNRRVIALDSTVLVLLTAGRTDRAARHRLRPAGPRPQPDHLRGHWRHRRHARDPGADPADGGALGAAAGRRLNGRETPPGRYNRRVTGAGGAAETRRRAGADTKVVEHVRQTYQNHLRILQAGGSDVEDDASLLFDRQYTALSEAVLAHKRATVMRLRDKGRTDDTVLRQIQLRL
jgi:hypothetical protein